MDFRYRAGMAITLFHPLSLFTHCPHLHEEHLDPDFDASEGQRLSHAINEPFRVLIVLPGLLVSNGNLCRIPDVEHHVDSGAELGQEDEQLFPTP